MKFFKHFSNMRNDTRIRRVISKYGLEGYGLYCIILETITEGLETSDPLPDLQDTCEDLADFYRGDTAKINEVVSYMINQGLFELDEITGRVLCTKIYKFIDKAQTRSQEIREMIDSYTKVSETRTALSKTVSDKPDKNRIEKNRTEENRAKKKKTKKFIPPTLEEVKKYCKERGSSVNPTTFFEFYDAGDWKDARGNQVKNWKQKLITWEGREKKNQPQPFNPAGPSLNL